MSEILVWLNSIGLDNGLIALAAAGISARFVILTWVILRKKITARKTQQNWYNRRCETLAHRHGLNKKELNDFLCLIEERR